MKKKRIVALVAALLLTLVPALAVFQEKDMRQTLTVLLYELKASHQSIQRRSAGSDRRETEQRRVLINLMRNCNELSLMLYSQPQDFTFDLTYALDEVTKQYQRFDANRMPYTQIVESLKIDLQRYDKLVQTLRNLPPAIEPDSLQTQPQSIVVLDSLEVSTDTLLSTPAFIQEQGWMDEETRALRDSCLAYAEEIVAMYWKNIQRIEEDSRYYDETDQHLKEAYDYAQERYRLVQKKVILGGQRSYSRILSRWSRYWQQVVRDCNDKYGTVSYKSDIVSEWRGPMVVWMMAVVFLYILFSVLLSTLIIRLTFKRINYFHSDYFRRNRMMFTALLGVVIFALTIMIANLCLPRNNFILMATRKLAEFAWLLAAIFASMLIRLTGEQSKHALKVYLPIIVTGFVIITFRVVFAPNSLLNILLPPLLLLVTVWQLVVNLQERGKIQKADEIYMWITLGVLVAGTVASLWKYVFIALVFLIWWIFQLTMLQTITAIFDLLSKYYDRHLTHRLSDYRKRNPGIPLRAKGAFIEVSWAYDLLKMAIVPIITIWSIPLCIVMAGNVFDLSSVTMDYFYRPLVHVEGVIHLSLFKVVMVATLYFIFRYVNYLSKSLYRITKTRAYLKKLGDGIVFKESDINFNLANNLISLICWGLYVVIAFVMLKIPTTALTIVTTGLATGIGFALKDVLNNFFYGIQLMSGRLRVGDVVECDGVRGTVDSMNYQTTTILANDGSIIAFSNSALFSKNFKNLTRNHSYEYLSIPVGVAYGTDIDKVRTLLVDALSVLQVKDKYGREVVDSKRGVTVRVTGFGDSSIDLAVVQFTTVDTHYTYAAQAREIIYNTLNENGIEIPFPQRDIHVKDLPDKD